METINRLILEDIQSRLFLLMANNNIDVIDGINKFMKSNLAKDIDRDFSSMHLCSSNIWLDELNSEVNLKNSKKNQYDLEAIFWLGYFYRKWHYITGEPSFKIVRYLSPLEGLNGYVLYHQIEENNAINIIKSRYNEKRNIHRKYDYKNIKSVLTYNDTKDKPLLAYLSKRMLYKLSNDERIKALRYNKEENYLTLKDRNESISVLAVDDNNLFKILNDYKAPDYQNKSVFIFLFNDKSSEDLKKEIEKIRDSELGNKYMFLYFYVSNNLYEINDAKEIHQYHMSFTRRDKLLAKKEIELAKAYDEIEDSI